MGIEDRDYYREFSSPREPSSSGNKILQNVLFWIIGLNVFFFLADSFLFPSNHLLTGFMSMHSFTLAHWRFWFEFLTYGFAHSPEGYTHILCNMLSLFFFAPHVIRRYGAGEFLFIYLLAIVVAGLYWGIAHFSETGQEAMLGASGAVTTVIFLFALNFPKATILIWFFPMPAWLAAIVFLSMDIFSVTGPHVAHDVHIVGVVFAVIYFLTRIRLCNIFHLFGSGKKTRSPKMKIYDPSKEKKSSGQTPISITVTSPEARDLAQKVDAILRKISKEGEASLTQEERETLFRASQEYQKRKDS